MKKSIISFIVGAAAAVICTKIYSEERSIGRILRRKPCNEPEQEEIPETPGQTIWEFEEEPELIVDDILDDLDSDGSDDLEQEIDEVCGDQA